MATPTVSITFTHGALALFGQLIGTPGLVTDPKALRHVGEFGELNCSDLVPPTDAEEAKAWFKAEKSLDLKPSAFEALKALLVTSIQKGQVSGHPAVLAAMRAVDLGKDD